MRFRLLLACLILGLFPSLVGQNSRATSPASAVSSSHSDEPYVIEQHSARLAYEKDGSFSSEEHFRARIQSEAGVQRYSVITVNFPSATSKIEQISVDVIKPDGTVIRTPESSVQDYPTEITRAAPFYSDLREKHIPVKGLAVNDLIVLYMRQQAHSPVPGQFWYTYEFSKTDVVLDDQLEISVPWDTFLHVNSPEVTPVISTVARRRTYVWRSKNVKREAPPKCAQHHHPSVQLSTFRDWAEVGEWYRSLQEKQAAPTPEVRAETAEVTKDSKTDDDKLQAIYRFVATNIHYLGVAFGIGRYQPHTAAEVLANGYGDCKDKHTLLQAMLAAADIKAFPALIGAGVELDPGMPYPGQFNHVITFVPLGNRTIWLDSTTEVAPFGMLMAALRDKDALVIGSSRPTLIKTPEQPPFPNINIFHVDAKLSDDGLLTGKIDLQARGDTELALRLAFRQVGRFQWQELAQRISQSMGYAGKVSDVSASTPEDTTEPFHLRYTYTREDYPDWKKNHQITAPLPTTGLPQFSDEQRQCTAVPFNASLNTLSVAEVTVPAGYSPVVPEGVTIKNSFGQYESSYSFEKGTLHVERHITASARELSGVDFQVYKDFTAKLDDDELQYIPLLKAPSGTPSTAEAVELYQQAYLHLQTRQFHEALDEFNRVLKLQPDYPGAWDGVGRAHLALAEMDEGIDALRKEIELHRGSEDTYKILATTLTYLHRPEEALEVWKQLAAVAPKDRDAAHQVGGILLSLKRYSEATSALEAAVRANPDDANLHGQLGGAYLQTSKLDEGASELIKAVALKPQLSNNAAYMLAESNTHLNDALQMAITAVREAEKTSSETNLVQPKISDLAIPPTLSAYWDTLGWVYFRLGQFDRAQQYLSAAWALSQDPSVGDHLGQVYEKLGKRDLAIHTYALASAASQGGSEPHKHLSELVHRDAAIQEMLAKSREEVSRLRMVRLPNIAARGSAEFFILFAPGQEPSLKFISGEEKLKSLESRLQAAHYNVLFPNDTIAKILRRGILVCPKSGTECDFAMMPITSVHSVN